MKTVSVDLGARTYDIRIGRGISACESLSRERNVKALLVSDSNVDPLYGDRYQRRLEAEGIHVARAVVPAGEGSKDLRCACELYGEALEAGLDRTSVIVALGGGMIGDLAGFVAATFLRGVRLIQIPTSLLAMVDSSVGGKTAINLPEGKNLVGVFHQPIEVTADLTSLKTLHDREYLSGLAEVVKYGVIWDPGLFRKLEQNAGKLVERDMDLLEEVITRCCEIKAEVVAIDEKEAGIRAVLNFGHTFGHALEKVSGYGRWLHGEAVAVGMVYEGRVSVGEKGFPEDEFERLRSLLCELKLPVSLGDRLSGRGAWKRIRDAMRSDKKTKASVPRFVLAERLGSVVFGCEVDEKTLEQSFAAVAAE